MSASTSSFFAQPADLDIDRPIERRRFTSTGLLEQEVAREHPVGMLDEGAEDREFARGQRDLPALAIDKPARGQVELPMRESVDVALCSGCGGRRGAGDSAKHGPDPRQKLADVERLGDVVVGADLEADDLVDRIAATADDHGSPHCQCSRSCRAIENPSSPGKPRSSSTSCGGSAAISRRSSVAPL